MIQESLEISYKKTLDKFNKIKEMFDLANKDNVSVAIVGFGKMGLLHAGLANLLIPGCVRYIVDTSRLIGLGVKRILKNVIYSRDLAKIINKHQAPTAVYITTPSHIHIHVMNTLLETGYNGYVFLEKPPFLNMGEQLSLKDHKLYERTMVGFQKRWAGPFLSLRELLNSIDLGEVQKVSATIKSGDVLEPTSRYDRIGRGVLLDLGIHVIDLLRWIFGHLEIVEAESKSIYTGVDDYFWARLVAGNGGIPIEFEASWSVRGLREPLASITVETNKWVVRATDDCIELLDPQAGSGGYVKRYCRPHYYMGFPPANLAGQEYSVEDMVFLTTVATKAPVRVNLTEVEDVMDMIDRLYGAAGVG